MIRRIAAWVFVTLIFYVLMHINRGVLGFESGVLLGLAMLIAGQTLRGKG